MALGMTTGEDETIGRRPRTVYALRTIAARIWAEQRNEENLAAAQQYGAGQGPFHASRAG